MRAASRPGLAERPKPAEDFTLLEVQAEVFRKGEEIEKKCQDTHRVCDATDEILDRLEQANDGRRERHPPLDR